MSTPADTPAPSIPPKSRAAGRAFRYLCPSCRAELTALLAEAQATKACAQCGQPATVPRAPVGINTGTGAHRLPVALAVGNAPQLPAVPLTTPALAQPPPVVAAPPPQPSPPRPRASNLWVAPFSASTALGILLGVVGFLAFAGFRHGRGVGDTDQLKAQLTFVQTQWRLAEAVAAGGGQGPEVLTELKTILQQAPAESDRWPAYLHDAVAKKLAPVP